MRSILLAALAAAIATPALARETTDCKASQETTCRIRLGETIRGKLSTGKDEDWLQLRNFQYGQTYVVTVKGVGQALPINLMGQHGQLLGTPQTSRLVIDTEALEVGAPVWVRVYSPIGQAGRYEVTYRRK